MKNKWAEIGNNIYDRTVKNRLNEMGFKYKKEKHQKARLQWTKEKKSWNVDDSI